MIMLEEIKKLQEEKDKAYDEFRKAYDQKCKEYNEKLLELLPYQDKCVKITDDTIYCVPQYIKVREIFKHGDKIVIRGYGFAGEFTEYADATWFDWSCMTSYDFEIYQVEDKVKCIEIIGELEFTDAFNELLNKMKFNHLNTMI